MELLQKFDMLWAVERVEMPYRANTIIEKMFEAGRKLIHREIDQYMALYSLDSLDDVFRKKHIGLFQNHIFRLL